MANSYQVSELVSARLQQSQPMLIDGQWCQASHGETLPVFNPSSAEQISELANGSLQDVDRAVAAARTSFDSGVWRKKNACPTGKNSLAGCGFVGRKWR